jgi:hypothetical protein
LFCYEKYLDSDGKGLKGNLFNDERFSKEDYTIEHILPQSVETAKLNDEKPPLPEGWESYDCYDKNQISKLVHSIGNLVLINKRKNPSIGNAAFTIKRDGKNRDGFVDGSYAERELCWLVSSDKRGRKMREIWDAESILTRGLKILNFIEIRFSIILGDVNDKIKLLGLDFLREKIQNDDMKDNRIDMAFSKHPHLKDYPVSDISLSSESNLAKEAVANGIENLSDLVTNSYEIKIDKDKSVKRDFLEKLRDKSAKREFLSIKTLIYRCGTAEFYAQNKDRIDSDLAKLFPDRFSDKIKSFFRNLSETETEIIKLHCNSRKNSEICQEFKPLTAQAVGAKIELFWERFCRIYKSGTDKERDEFKRQTGFENLDLIHQIIEFGVKEGKLDCDF